MEIMSGSPPCALGAVTQSLCQTSISERFQPIGQGETNDPMAERRKGLKDMDSLEGQWPMTYMTVS